MRSSPKSSDGSAPAIEECSKLACMTRPRSTSAACGRGSLPAGASLIGRNREGRIGNYSEREPFRAPCRQLVGHGARELQVAPERSTGRRRNDALRRGRVGCPECLADDCDGNDILREERDRGWIPQSYPCFEPRQVFENLEDQRKMGREAWVEDAGGKVLDEMTFKPK